MNKTVVGLVALAATGILGGCEKPNPGVTFWSGSASERVAPVCFSNQGAIDPGQCLQDAASRALSGEGTSLEVAQETVVGISVDPAVAEQGWTVTVAGERLTQQPLTSTYYRFTFPRIPADEQGLPLAVVVDADEMKGVWSTRLMIREG